MHQSHLLHLYPLFLNGIYGLLLNCEFENQVSRDEAIKLIKIRSKRSLSLLSSHHQDDEMKRSIAGVQKAFPHAVYIIKSLGFTELALDRVQYSDSSRS